MENITGTQTNSKSSCAVGSAPLPCFTVLVPLGKKGEQWKNSLSLFGIPLGSGSHENNKLECRRFL